MSAIVCGKRRSFFDDLPAASSTPVAKKIRCSSSTSPVRFSPLSPPSRSAFVDKLREVFPLMDQQLIEQALEECGDDIDAAIRRLHELCLGSLEDNSGSLNNVETHAEQGGLAADKQATANPQDSLNAPPQDSLNPNALPADGNEWVELFVREMMSASSVDDARARAARVLEVLEKSIRAHAGAEAAENIQKENMMLKEQIQALMRENAILKRGVQIQHERQKEYDDKSREVQQLKQLVSQYHEQLRTLEVTNYTLTMHLKQAQQNSSMPGRFHPDVF
uniref:CUE domain-containing protein n=1 Tax=Opuntia streptacantha TaxID=393608 RepID=A0A7C9EQL2_OPUST